MPREPKPDDTDPLPHQLSAREETLADLVTDPRRLIGAMSSMAMERFAAARSDLMMAENLNCLIRDLMQQKVKDSRVMAFATDIGNLKSAAGRERLDRLRLAYGVRNDALQNSRREAREAVFIMGKAAELVRLGRQIVSALPDAAATPVDPETEAALKTAAKRLERLHSRRVQREAKQVESQREDVEDARNIEPEPPVSLGRGYDEACRQEESAA